MTDLVRERVGAVVVLRLNRPDARNALTVPLLAELGDTVEVHLSTIRTDPWTFRV